MGSRAFWSGFLRARRGLRGVKLVISDRIGAEGVGPVGVRATSLHEGRGHGRTHDAGQRSHGMTTPRKTTRSKAWVHLSREMHQLFHRSKGTDRLLHYTAHPH